MFHPNSIELSKMDKEVADLIAKEKEDKKMALSL